MKVDDEIRQERAEVEMDVIPDAAGQADKNEVDETGLPEADLDQSTLSPESDVTPQPELVDAQADGLVEAEAQVGEGAGVLESTEPVESAAVGEPQADVSGAKADQEPMPPVAEMNDLAEEDSMTSTEMVAGDAAEAGTDEPSMAAPKPEPETAPESEIERAIEAVSQDTQELAETEPIPGEPAEMVTYAVEAPEMDAAEAEAAETRAGAMEAQPGPEQMEAVAEAETAEADDDRHWYVVHCYSGYENKVRHNLEQRIESMGMKDKIFDVVVPTEEEIEVKEGKRRTVERRVFPGYILVQMIMTEESWYVVRNTPGVTGFVGMGNEPTPLRPEEVAQIIRRMEAEAPRVKVAYKVDQKVRIIDGPFNDFIGTVDDIDMERAKVRVMVSFFGRETPVELDFLQVEKA